MADFGLDLMQIRLQWRQNETREGSYTFDDVDMLFTLAEKYNREVIIKFMLEDAPQYIFEKYGGYRRNYDGTPILPSSHGAFYIGGWMPCFDNPMVVKHARKFVAEVVNRYRGKKSLVLWHVWNEPRSRPVGDCFCEYSKKLYHDCMKKEYGAIDKFNRFWGTAEDDFDNLQTPGMPDGYWDFFLYRKWRSSVAIADHLSFVYDEIRCYDMSRPVMAHVGCSAVIQNDFNDNSDDFMLSKRVDFYGTSYPVYSYNDTDSQYLGQMICDFLRCVDKNYFVHELYSDWGNWNTEAPREALRYYVWNILAHGAKGVLYWQMRAERLGCENNLSSFLNMDGTDKEITKEVGYIGRVLFENREVFRNASCRKSEVVIVFDYDSSLLSQIEDHNDKLFSFGIKDKPIRYYYKALLGMYKLFWRLNIDVDFIDSREIEKIEGYKVAYFPYATMLSPQVETTLMKYQGVLILDEGFGLRSPNTWLNPNQTSFNRLLNNTKWYCRV